MMGRTRRVPRPIATATITAWRLAVTVGMAILLAHAVARVAAAANGVGLAGRAQASSPASPTNDAAAATTAADLAAAGDALYAAGDLSAAAAAYAEAAELGGLTSARAVRLGNAYVRLGAPGRAMAAYRLAEASAPRQAALRANVAWLRAELARGAVSSSAVAGEGTADRTDTADTAGRSTGSNGSTTSDGTDEISAAAASADPAELPVVDRAAVFAPAPRRVWSLAWWAVASRSWLSLDTLAALALGAWWVAVLALWAGRLPARRMARLVAGGALGVALLAGVLLGARMVRRATAVPAVIVQPGQVAVRQGPGMPFAAARSLPEGADVRYVERRGRWLRLADEGGESGGGGWIAASAVVDVPE